ncbi:MAG: hypothetical protein JNL51_11835 [Chitinophagaceae bacterium]|nr:hypothetical protein [Chitinophagaceae bacterium]
MESAKSTKPGQARIILLLFIVIAAGAYLFFSQKKGEPAPASPEAGLYEKPQKEIPVEGKYIFKSAAELGAMLRNKEASVVDITKAFIAHIKNNNYKYNAIVWLREKEALEDAQKADEAIARGEWLSPLHGIPVTVKEEYWVKGSPVTLNANLYRDFVAPEDGELVKQLKRSGAIILGKSNVPTLLMDYQTQGEIYPTASNPYDTTRSPGGSTGGGAAALAAGFTTLALGSDLGGSIRVPASYCGLYSLKTSFGSLNTTEGDGPDTTSKKKRRALNVAGPLARTPEDLEAAWLILRDAKKDLRVQQPIAWKQASDRPISEYRIAWIDDWKNGDNVVTVGKDVKEKLGMLIDSIKHHGALVKNTAPDTYGEMMRSYLECLALLSGEGQPESVRNNIKTGMKQWEDGTGRLAPFYNTMDNPDDVHWRQWQENNEKLKAKWVNFLGQYDFFICPITYGPAIKKCPKGTPITIDGETVSYFRYSTYTTIFNPIEVPSITIPLGLNKEGLPIVVQIVGPMYSEPELLHFAKLLKPFTPGFIRPRGL